MGSALIDDHLKQELTAILSKLTAPVVMKAVVDRDKEKDQELAAFLEVMATLSDKIKLELYSPEEEGAMELDREFLPVTGLYKDGIYSGVAFHGVPGGKEINSFVLALYNLAGPGQELAPRTRKAIEKLNKKTNIKVCVSLACHHCPKVVAACQRLAILNPNIEAEMIDATLYKELVERYHIERVPVIIINNKDIHVGVKTLEEMVNIVK